MCVNTQCAATFITIIRTSWLIIQAMHTAISYNGQVIVRRSYWVFYLGMIGKKVKVALPLCAPTGYFQPWPDLQETVIATIAVLRHNSPVNCDVSSCTICAYLPQITGLLWLQVSSRLWLSCSRSNNGNYEKYSWHCLWWFFDEVWSWRYGR